MKQILTLLLLAISQFPEAQPRFTTNDTAFLLDGKPFRIISGEIHYTRVPREAWRHRMKMAKAMGLNTIGTYVFWNVHEPQNNRFDFKGNNDIAAFVKTAKEEGLWVILRPSPYVCAEWEFGGYPFWLQNIPGLKVRSMEPGYIREYQQYIREVGKQLAPLEIGKGGNILMVQVENEYGSYGKDKDYLDLNRKMFREAGFDGMLYTCDPANDLANGSLNGLMPAVNGLDNPDKVKSLIRQNNGGKGPFFIAEWYPAWFDWWGTKHHTIPAGQYAKRLDSVLGAGISINLYMFHGGTTRDFMNGANYNDRKPFEPQISSYDYDAPLDEAGNPTAKFIAFRDAIQKHVPNLPPVPSAKPATALPPVALTETMTLLDHLPPGKTSGQPLTFEDLNQPYGFVLYRKQLKGGSKGWLKLQQVRDYALVMVNGRRVGVLDRRLKQDSLALELPDGDVQLDILVENLGRINFGPYLLQNKKGITENVSWNGEPITGWQNISLPMDKAPNVRKGSPETENLPVLKRGSFSIGTPTDTYLDMSAWGKGVVWINGHNLGRYWSIGPQQTLYVPAEWLKKGKNEVVILELLGKSANQLSSRSTPILDQLQAPRYH